MFVNASTGFYPGLGSGADINPARRPFSASVDVKLPFTVRHQAGLVFFTLGGTFFYFAPGAPLAASSIGFGIRPAVHIAGLTLLKKLLRGAALYNVQAYLAVPAGYRMQRRDGGTVDDSSGFHAGLDLGVQYFLAKNLGLYVELSFTSRRSGGSFGRAVRF
ncbi:MAG: hypothetical protein LBC88_02315 [Spirochaetaceae bacterium]|nr:hypothetical protein [Spirochaetaceae bacterium]